MAHKIQYHREFSIPKTKFSGLNFGLNFRQHSGEHFQPQILLVPQAVGPALDHRYPVVKILFDDISAGQWIVAP